VVAADARVQTPVVGVDDVYRGRLGTVNLQLTALARVPSVPAVIGVVCACNNVIIIIIIIIIIITHFNAFLSCYTALQLRAFARRSAS